MPQISLSELEKGSKKDAMNNVDDQKAPNLWLHTIHRNPEPLPSRPRSYHPFYVRGGMSYSTSSVSNFDAGSFVNQSSVSTSASQIPMTRIDGDARQLTADEYRKVSIN